MPINFKLVPASLAYKDVIKNLMQFYIYDFSEYTKDDVGSNGLFGDYTHLEEYWKDEDHRFPYIIVKDEKYVGFVLVKFIKSANRDYFSIAEFFIMKKYRREGIGKAVAEQIFNIHKGQWEISQRESNKPAQEFWNNVIDGFTKGQFKERGENGRRIQGFKSS